MMRDDVDNGSVGGSGNRKQRTFSRQGCVNMLSISVSRPMRSHTCFSAHSGADLVSPTPSCEPCKISPAGLVALGIQIGDELNTSTLRGFSRLFPLNSADGIGTDGSFVNDPAFFKNFLRFFKTFKMTVAAKDNKLSYRILLGGSKFFGWDGISERDRHRRSCAIP